MMESDQALFEIVPDEDHDVLADVTQTELRAALSGALDKLEPRERPILRMRYLDGPHTLDYIGAHLGITRERVRQIEYRAMKKLRHPYYGRGLHQFLMEG